MKTRILKALVLSSTILTGGLVFRFGTKPSLDASSTQQDRRHWVISSMTKESTRKQDEHETKVLAQALEKKPGHVPVLLRLARLASESGRIDTASQYLNEAIGLEPHNLEAHLELGKLLYEAGNIQGAIEQTEQILKEQPMHADALYNLGAIYGNLGNKKRALDYWNRLLAANPQSESGQRARQMIGELQNTAN